MMSEARFESEQIEEMDVVQKEELRRRLPFSNQYVFAKTMGSNKELCAKVIERVLGRKVRNVEIVNAEHAIPSIEGRGVRLDVLIEGEDEIYDVEMQAFDEDNIAKRLRFYHAHIDQMQLRKGAPIHTLRPVYVIFFCLFDPFRSGLPMYTLRRRCVQAPEMPYNDGATSIIVAACNYKSEEKIELSALMRYVATNVPDDSLTIELAEAVDEAYEDESWVRSMLTMEQRIAEREYVAEKRGKAEDNRRYKELMAKLNSSDMSSEEIIATLSEGDLEDLFERFDIE